MVNTLTRQLSLFATSFTCFYEYFCFTDSTTDVPSLPCYGHDFLWLLKHLTRSYRKTWLPLHPHFPSLLTQTPLSNNRGKKNVRYFTVVASGWCHGMFFSLWCVWQISKWCLSLPSWIPWLYFQYQKVLAKILALCVIDITTFPAVVSSPQSFKNTILPCRWLQPYPIRSFLAVMVQ